MKLIYTSIALVFIFFILLSFSFVDNKKPKASKYSANEQLGRLLFFDNRLSVNKSKSCASCHKPNVAFADNEVLPLGAFGDTVPHNTPTIINLADNELFNWANDNLTTLQQQSNFPLFGKHPIEMGNDSLDNTVFDFVYEDALYKPLLKKNKISKLNWNLVKDLIASYVKTMKFRNSKYDKFLRGEIKLTKDEMAGKNLFFSESINCKKCHNGRDFDEPEFTMMNPYQNIGLYSVGKDSMYGNNDNGLYDINKDKDDIGKFKIPTLRNVLLTAPYFHDGSADNIVDVINHYERGGRLTLSGKNAGDGKFHPNKNEDVNGFKVSEKQKKQLISFLNTLTDTSYLKNSFFKSPF